MADTLSQYVPVYQYIFSFEVNFDQASLMQDNKQEVRGPQNCLIAHSDTLISPLCCRIQRDLPGTNP